MGQTLSHGVYLPNEGERNCYTGLASNWQILNTAVGNIAEKAPLVHTHGNITNDGKVGTTANLPLITGTGGVVQAGSFGNQANTFCEGNDSRLSDARTPVAHTHTKSDVTDLLNSNFIPSANNSYDLGSSSYQWNNLYAKNYFYNGTAWGLDQANVWNTYQTIKGYYFGNEQSSNGRTCLYLTSNRDTVGQSGIYITKFRHNRGQGGLQPVDLQYLAIDVLENSVRTNNVLNLIITDWNNDIPSGAILNSALSNAQLGTSTNKWKALNGINPGALSLPNVRAAVADPIDTVGWNLTGSRNTYTPTEDGWFFIRVAGTDGCSVNVHAGSSSNDYPTWTNSSAAGDTTLVIPAEKGIPLYVYVKATSIEYCSFRPCLGNV